jgi:hypothetical protein
MSPTDPQDEPPHYQVQRVREALAHDPRVGELELEVTIRAGKVFVAGTVHTPDVQQGVTAVISEVVPHLELHNQTSVAAFPESEEVENL